MRTLFVLVAATGAWLFVSPFVLGYLGIARGNALILGAVITAFGLIGIAGTTSTRR